MKSINRLAAAQAMFSARMKAQATATTPKEMADREEFWRQQHAKAARQAVARESQRLGLRTPRPKREMESPPRRDRRWIRSMAARAMRDRRLTSSARVVLALVVGRVGFAPERRMTKAMIAKDTGFSRRTVQRALGQLTLFGYISRRLATGARGMVTGMIVALTAVTLRADAPKAVLDAANGGFPGETRLSWLEGYLGKPPANSPPPEFAAGRGGGLAGGVLTDDDVPF